MTKNVKYPAKTRDNSVGKGFPPRTRSAGTNRAMDGVGTPSQHSTPKPGKPPKKGVLTSGGGHG